MKRNAGLAFIAVAALSACGLDSDGPSDMQDPTRDREAPQVEGKIGDMLGGYSLAGEEEAGGAILVNKHLWAAALDTISFMPLASTDPFSGVIATDWSADPQSPGERTKVAVFIDGVQLEARSLKVAVYREIRSEAGEWVSAPVSAATPRRLEDLILTRARQMRVADLQADNAG